MGGGGGVHSVVRADDTVNVGDVSVLTSFRPTDTKPALGVGGRVGFSKTRHGDEDDDDEPHPNRQHRSQAL